MHTTTRSYKQRLTCTQPGQRRATRLSCAVGSLKRLPQQPPQPTNSITGSSLVLQPCYGRALLQLTD